MEKLILSELIENNRKWIKEKLGEDEKYFEIADNYLKNCLKTKALHMILFTLHLITSELFFLSSFINGKS